MGRPLAKAYTRPRSPALWLAACLAATGLWAAAASAALLFHDDLLAAFVARQAAMQAAYEERLADLTRQLDRGGREGIERGEAIASRLAASIERQAELERRQAALADLGGKARDTGEEPMTTGTLSSPPVSTPSDFRLRHGDGRRSDRETELRLAALEGRIGGLAAAQAVSLDRIAERAGADVARLRRMIGRTGLDPARFTGPVDSGLGGPLVPVDAGSFSGTLTLTRRAVADADRLRRAAATLPLHRPLAAENGIASGFGPRLDPFSRGLALHTGLDLKAEMGEPARATAAGRVVSAEAAGGYGNMVEIDHGHGVVTRFAHLSRIAVRAGQWVGSGDPIGRVGSTGRSTGAHLHYETRIDGEPVDPQGFLDAGRDFASAEP